ncbi:uncharacterized protein LOC135369341 [Ornithodoros turicata]|uniref:uncharacterized protein LOC135369341 n=1 Tax=Ornithodoros turicata TaxID=34597 RepID=UPI0031388F42
MVSRTTLCIFIVLAVAAAVCNAQFRAGGGGRRPNFNFRPEPPRHRVEVFGSGGGNNRRNFNANVGVRGEYDLHRFRNGGRITGHVEGSQSFGRFDGHSYRGKPQGGVGISAHISF